MAVSYICTFFRRCTSSLLQITAFDLLANQHACCLQFSLAEILIGTDVWDAGGWCRLDGPKPTPRNPQSRRSDWRPPTHQRDSPYNLQALQELWRAVASAHAAATLGKGVGDRASFVNPASAPVRGVATMTETLTRAQ